MPTTIIDDISLDRERRIVRRGTEEVHLTGLEYDLLAYLVAHANRLCTREDILDGVWGNRFQYDQGTIDVHLNALRRKMGWSNKHPIETIRGAGLIFRLDRPVSPYTLDLQAFVNDWLRSHEVEIKAAGLTVRQRLTPFVNVLTLSPDALRHLLDSVLIALLPSARPGILTVSSQLTMQSFVLSLDINGTVNELRIPINGDLEVS